MTDIEIINLSGELLLKIHVITGWTIPANEIMILFADQFKKKLIESYQNVNVDEFEYAFRHFSGSVKDWGKQMNLSLIDEVMTAYLSSRSEISKMEESKSKPKELTAPEITELDMFEWIEHTKIQYEKGKITFNLLPVILFDFLNGKGLMPGNKLEVWERAKKQRISELQNELCSPNANKDSIKKELNYLNSGKIDKNNPFHLPTSLVSKRIMLVDYFKTEIL